MPCPALPCPALPCPALPCPAPNLRLKQRFTQPRFYLLGSISAVLSIALLFTHSAHAQSNWWEQQKPVPSERSTESSSQADSVTPKENSSAQKNTTKPANNHTDTPSIPNTYYFEGGVVDIELTDVDESANGGYFRVSLGPPHIHFLGGYQNPVKDFSITEIGIGSISKHPLQLTTSLTRQIWKVGEADRSFNKVAIGLRTQFSPHFDMWIGAGYMWTSAYTVFYNYQGQEVGNNFVDTSVGNLGLQFLITPDFGIVFELDVLNDMGIDFFKAGLRANF